MGVRALAGFGALFGADYVLWDWSLHHHQPILSVLCGLAIAPLALLFLGRVIVLGVQLVVPAVEESSRIQSALENRNRRRARGDYWQDSGHLLYDQFEPAADYATGRGRPAASPRYSGREHSSRDRPADRKNRHAERYARQDDYVEPDGEPQSSEGRPRRRVAA
ncbi:MAG TPA: hypothetical protein VHX88_08690 [Solirubrobacteraceae bacterium]|jgi:hypothetical protein|nr:hypothetical protein [Solirubrobacteraceae bacterium]